jgi:lambda family phage portal protein
MSAGDMSELSAYDSTRLDWHNARPIGLGGAQVNFLHSGEKITLTKPNHPNAVFEHYLRAALRNIASVLGLTYEQFSSDFSQTNYSSFRGALLEAWRGFSARRGFFTNQIPQQIFACFLEEKIDKGIIKLPPGAPDFHAKKAAYCAAEWIGPAKGWVDPVKEGEGAVLRINSGLSSYRREMAEQGIDYRKDFLQQARERKERETLGLPDALSQIAGQVKGNAGNVPQTDPKAADAKPGEPDPSDPRPSDKKAAV